MHFSIINHVKTRILLASLLGVLFFTFFVTTAQAEVGSTGNTREAVACTMDAKQCPDGSYVGRVAPNCEFAACGGDSGEAAKDTLVENHQENAKRAAMKEQIKQLQAMIAERKAQLAEKHEAVKEQVQENRVERKEQRVENRAEFMKGLEGLSEEEKKAAMLQYITQLQEYIATKKAELQAKLTERKEQRKEVKEEWKGDKEEFRSDLGEMTPAERYAAIMERVAELSAKLEAKVREEAGGDEEDGEDAEEDETNEDEEAEASEEDVDDEGSEADSAEGEDQE